MATNVQLTPELERFAQRCVESGRYPGLSEVMRSALRMLESAETNRAAFGAMLEDVRAEAEREGVYTIEAVTTDMDSIIDNAR